MKNVATDQEIESVFDQMGLTAYTERAAFLGGAGTVPTVNYEIVFSTTSNPFAA